MRSLRALLDSFSAALELSAAEIRAGVKLVDAVAADERNTELLAVLGSQEAVNDMVSAATEFAKCGLRAAEVPDAARLYLGGNWHAQVHIYQVREHLDRLDKVLQGKESR